MGLFRQRAVIRPPHVVSFHHPRSPQAKEDESYATVTEIARKALNLQLRDRTGGALYFHQRNATPGWAAEYTKTVEIGEFRFYKPRGGEAR